MRLQTILTLLKKTILPLIPMRLQTILTLLKKLSYLSYLCGYKKPYFYIKIIHPIKTPNVSIY
jgi:hypothetical protein